jgi:hypothetical protein
MTVRRHLVRIGSLAGLPLVTAWLAVAVLMLAPSPRVTATGTAPITVPFDHLSTGFELDGVHRDLPCESCHLNAVFKGTPRDCGVCHITGSVFNATPKIATHIQSTNNCAACHDTASFRPDVHFDHTEVMGNCVTCHNGTIARGEGPTHPATSEACAACHTVMSWNPPKTVDHTQIPLAVAGFCIICHNGQQASGKPTNHITTTLECGDCHLTSNWLGAGFDHTGIRSGCVSCHNGVKAVGKQGSHMPTTALCENCHTTGIGTKTPSWVPSGFDHTQMTVTTCATCHSGTVKLSTGFVPGQPTNHVPPIPAAIDCGVCHGNTPTAETWAMLAASIATLHSGLSVNNCLLCHAGETFAGAPAPYIPMSITGVSPAKKTPLSPPHIPILPGADCSACHGAAYNAGGFGPATAMSAAKHAVVSTSCDTCHDTGRSFYVGSGTPLQLRPADHVNSTDPRMATGDCSACHETTDWNTTVLPAGHMPNPGNQTCAACHTAISNNIASYATLASIAVLHTGITGNCGQCHGSPSGPLTFYNNNDNPKAAVLTPSHIPYLSGTDCSSCHAANYVTGGFGPTNMSAAKHAFVPTNCDTCHEANLSFYTGASTPALQGRPADHTTGTMLTGDCSGCHETTDWNTTALPSGHMPNPGNQVCSICHTGYPSNMALLASLPILHTGITTGCAQCHGSTTQLTFYNNNDNPKAAVLTPPHIPSFSGTDCSSCHTANYVAGGFGPMNMTQATHAGVGTTCNTCHEAGLSFYMGTASPGLQGRPADHTTGQMVAPNDCSICHTTANWNSNAMPAGHMPNPANSACTVCHTKAPSDYTTTTLAANAVIHTGITSGCITCHGAPNATPPVFYPNYSPKSAVLSPVHIPTSTTACESCHANNVFTAFSGTTMTSAKHTAMFAVIGSTCDACHNKVTPALSFYGVTNLQTRPSDHSSGNKATNDCSGCHNTNNWNGGAQTKKTVAATTRSTVGLVVNAGPALRPQIGASVVPRGAGMGSTAGLSHVGVFADCVSCHNGVLAPGKGSAHIASNNACGYCHTTAAWIPARFDHQGVTAACASCHNGIVASGKPTRHVQTNEDCGACHGAIAWAPATFSHIGVNAPCQSCHNGSIATGKQIQHLATTLDCGTCHATLNWTATTAPATAAPRPLISSPKPRPRGAASGSIK